MSETTTQTAADYLVSNLWGNPKRIYAVAAYLPTAESMPSGDARAVYAAMLDLMRNPDRPYTISELESNLNGTVDAGYMMRLGFRTREDDEDALLGYVQSIKEAARKESSRRAFQYGLLELEEGGDPGEIVPEVVRRLATEEDPSNQHLKPIGTFFESAITKVKDWQQGVIEGYSTGLPTMDKVVRFRGPELTLLTGRPGSGKTSLVMQNVENIARTLQETGDKGCVAVFSAEMSGTDLAIRMACAHARVDSHKAQRGQLTGEEYHRLEMSMHTLHSLPIRVDETSSPTTDENAIQGHDDGLRIAYSNDGL